MRLSARRLACWLVVVCGIWQVGLGLYFIFARPALLPEDIRYLEADWPALQAAAPRLGPWLDKVFTVMGGFMAGSGVLSAYVGWRDAAQRGHATTAALSVAGLLTLTLMSAVNFALHSDYRWLLLAPPVVWFAALLLAESRPSPFQP
jgi:hypothetical protein